MTGRGIGWIFLVLATWLALAYSGIAQLQLFWAVLLVLPLVSLAQMLYLRRRIRLSQQLERTVILRGETTKLQVRIGLQSRQMVGLAELVLEKTGKNDLRQEEERFTALLPQADAVVTVTLHGHHRGSSLVGLRRLSCRDLFGLFKIRILSCPHHQLPLDLTVLPRPYAFARLDDLSSMLLERQKMRAYKPGSDLDAIANIRQQLPGDALKRTHWKLTARLDEVMIREFENPLQQEVLVLCDMARQPAAGFSWQQYGDFFTDCAAHVVQVVLQTGSAVRLVTWQADGRREVQADQPEQETNIQHFLSRLKESGAWQTGQVIDGEAGRHPDTRIFLLLTNRLQPATIRQLIRTALSGRLVWLFLLQGSEPLPEKQHKMLDPLHQAGVSVCHATYAGYAAEKPQAGQPGRAGEGAAP